MSAFYLTTMFDNCVSRRQLSSCSVTSQTVPLYVKGVAYETNTLTHTHHTHTHTHTPESLFLYPKHHTNYHPHQNKRVPHPEREKDNGIVPCNDVVCSQREQQRKHQKAAAHHKVTEERTYKGTCPYSLQTITFGCCGHILFLQQLEEALLVPSFSPGVESVDEFFEVHDVLQRHLCLNIRA